MSKPIAHLKDLTPDPRNARAHNPRNVGMIENALHEVGAARSIVIDEDGIVLAGNATIEAAAQAGIERVQVVDADGETIIAVRRRGLTSEQKVKLALFDNRAAELAEWDAGVLAELAAETDLSQLFRDDEMAALLAEMPGPDIGGAGDEFDPVLPEGPTRTAPGDLWQIGPHRLIVGDCTDPAVVERLMGGERAAITPTDPPYNVKMDYGDQVDDDKTSEEYEQFSRVWLYLAQQYSDRQIVTPGGQNLMLWARWFDPFHIAAWTKPFSTTNGKVAHLWSWEPVFFFGLNWPRKRANDIFEYGIQYDPKLDGMHPCPKPLALWLDLIENYTDRGNLVYEPFSGSGTTLIAAHQTGRRCYGCEIEPKYADRSLARAEAAGLTCTRVGE